MKRGEIYYIKASDTIQVTGSEQRANRPAIIVSNSENNENANTIEIVYLTTQPKSNIPTHVRIGSTGRESIALCEQITTISTERIENYMGECTAEEMQKIEKAIMVSLSISDGENKKLKAEIAKLQKDMLELEKSIYKNIVYDMLNKGVENK